MFEKTINIVVVQPPELCARREVRDPENCRGYLENLMSYYKYNGAVTVQNTPDFIKLVLSKVTQGSGAMIKTLIIGSHGAGGKYGYFRIGNDIIDAGSTKELVSLIVLTPFFYKYASVYILACDTGQNHGLLNKVSTVLGGVRVWGYDKHIETNGYSIDHGGAGVLCVRSKCESIPWPPPDSFDLTEHRFPPR